MSEPWTIQELTLDELHALRAEWAALCDRSACTPFQRPEWLLPWIATFAPSAPWLLSLRSRDARLVALAPLFVWTRGERRVVSLVGAGISDHLDAVVEHGNEREVGSRILLHLATHRDRWDTCELEALSSSAALAMASAPPRWVDVCEPSAPSPRLTWQRGERAWESCVPAHQQARLRKYRSRLQRETCAALACTRGSPWSEALADLYRLHDARWRDRAGGMLADETVRAFHRAVAAGFAEQGTLRIYRLVADGECIAALYGFVERDALYCYLQGIAPSAADRSPGTILLGMVIEDAAREGLLAIDFLRGREPYKYAWGAVDLPAHARRLAHRPTITFDHPQP